MKKKRNADTYRQDFSDDFLDVTMRRLIFLILMLNAACSGVEMKNPANNVQNNVSNNANNVAQMLKLRFVSPSNGELSMASQSRAQVEAVLETMEGLPAPKERVELHIEGAAAGSTLSATFAVSDASGKLAFQISSGSNSAHFRVILQHPQAVPIELDVTVSSSGMVRLRVAFSYEGTLDPGDLGMLELGIAFEASCDAIEPYRVELDRVHRISSWSAVEELTELPVDFSFSIVARGFSAAGEPLLHGCLTPDASMLIPNATVNVAMSLADYAKKLSERLRKKWQRLRHRWPQRPLPLFCLERSRRVPAGIGADSCGLPACGHGKRRCRLMHSRKSDGRNGAAAQPPRRFGWMGVPAVQQSRKR
jgi:hypothetical protein